MEIITIKKYDSTEQFMNVGIDDLDLSPRAFNALLDAELKTVSQIAQLSKKQLMDYKGIGNGVFLEIQIIFNVNGVEFKK
jgi:DNA-directed RNA polymerase alpha subunit